MKLRTTTTQRTYRYLRLSIVGAVLLLSVSLTATIVADGPISSISAAFYTPARSVFVGALFATTLALVALSGHSLEQALLDLAALFAPVIAIVPTPVRTGDVPGIVVDCPTATPCVPSGEWAAIDNGMLALAVVGVIGVVAALVLVRVQGTLSRALGWAIGAAGAVVLGVGGWWLWGRDSFVQYGHLTATTAFFTLIAAVAVVGAVGSRGPWRGWYTAIAIGIVAALIVVVGVTLLRLGGGDIAIGVAMAGDGASLFFAGEVAVVALFAVFWIVQTAENWSETDPGIRA